MKESKGVVKIGTSGIVVPGNKETFPAEFKDKSRLNYYGSLFNTLEVNSTFKKIPLVSTFERWFVEVPETFEFTVKLWREVTHVKQLKTDLTNIDRFFAAANHIGNKKGCLLVQFPGSITLAYFTMVEQILQRISELNGADEWLIAVEFRSLTWYVGETYELLNDCNASLVLHDMPKSKNLSLIGSAPFAYFRFHGPTGDYRGSYNEEFLKQQAEKMIHCINNGKKVYAYFNNTMGNAFENAMTLKAMVESATEKFAENGLFN